jgi:hypothetical protein
MTAMIHRLSVTNGGVAVADHEHDETYITLAVE